MKKYFNIQKTTRRTYKNIPQVSEEKSEVSLSTPVLKWNAEVSHLFWGLNSFKANIMQPEQHTARWQGTRVVRYLKEA